MRALSGAVAVLGVAACHEPSVRAPEQVVIEGRQATSAAVDVAPPVAPPPRWDGRLALGHNRACFVRRDHTVVCWGTPPGSSMSPEPAVVPGLADVVQIVGDSSWCARRRDGTVLCWSEASPLAPVASGARDISESCAVLEDGGVSCWEDGKVARLGFIHGARALSHRASASHGYALLGGGAVVCWGFSYQRTLCDGSVLPEGAAEPRWPLPVGVSNATQVDDDAWVGGACALSEGHAWCWGGEHGGLPAYPAALDGAVQLAVAEYHVCARMPDATVVCIGGNDSNQLGVAGAETTRAAPSVAHVVEVRTGGGEPCGGCGSTCVLTAADEVLCWGTIAEGKAEPTRVDVAAAR